jgi:hypothetical protein
LHFRVELRDFLHFFPDRINIFVDNKVVFSYILNMKFILNDHIDNYIQRIDNSYDKAIARHLKKIIVATTHLDKNMFSEIIEEIKKKMDDGKDFKTAFHAVREKYLLTGDVIEAELPDILTRVILNKKKIIFNIKRNLKTPFSEKRIAMVIKSKNKPHIARMLGKMKLSRDTVVFATFDEKRKDANPFLHHKVIDIINRLALDKDAFEKDEPITAVKIRYKDRKDMAKRFPTFIDAGWYDKFYPAKKNDKYGRTRSLDPLLEGMPEIVHENIKVADVIEDIELLED